MSTTTNLVVTNIEASQGSKEVTANDAFAAFDKAIAGRLSQAITTADVTLSDDDARNAIIALTGTLTGNRALIVPTRTKLYLIHNNTAGAFAVTVKTSAGTGVVVPQGSKLFLYCDGTNVVGAQTEAIIIPIGDETTAIVAGAPLKTFRMPFAMTPTAVRASLTTAASTGTFTIDINETGSGTILSTKLTIDATEKTSTTAATPAVISDTALADDAEITIDVDDDAAGDATGLKITLIGVRA